MRQVLYRAELATVDRARQRPAVRARPLILDAFDDDLTDVVVLLIVLVLAADRHDPEPLQAEQQRRSVSHARGSQVG